MRKPECIGFGLLGVLLWCMASAVQAVELRVSAAASLTDVISEISRVYAQQHAGVIIKSSYAGSSTLAKQIAKGAPADIFISADQGWADYLEARGLLLSSSRHNLLHNELVLIAPLNSTVKVRLHNSVDLPASFTGKLCTGEPAHVPVGQYAQQALSFYGWWPAIQSRLVGTEDVRTALAFVERGECALGIVYKTDALLSKKVQLIAHFPPESHSPIVYPGGLIKNASAEANSFWQFLQSRAAADIFIRYGFAVSPN